MSDIKLPIGNFNLEPFQEAKPIDWNWERNREDLIRRCIKFHGEHNYAQVAKALGIGRTTFYRILRKMKYEPTDT